MDIKEFGSLGLMPLERIEIGVAGKSFDHLGEGTLLTDRVGYFGMLHDRRTQVPGEDLKSAITIHTILQHDNLSRDEIEIPLSEIGYIRRLNVETEEDPRDRAY